MNFNHIISSPVGLYSPYVSEPHSKSDASYIEKKAVSQLYNQMKDQNYAAHTRSVSSAATLTSLCVDISPSSSNFFEVLYIGKIKNWQTYVSNTFVDDALEKFRLHELEKSKDTTNSETSSLGNSPCSFVNKSESYHSPIPEIRDEHESSVDSSKPVTSPADLVNKNIDINIEEDNINFQDPNNESSKSSQDGSQNESNKPLETDDHNRTMVLQVDRTDLRLISPDRKLILLHKHHKDVISCMQGVIKSDHFGFVCRESNGGMIVNIGYVFKCESSSIAADSVAAITQAFLNTEIKDKTMITSCEHCPMVWFHKLCTEVEHMSDKKTEAVILRRLDQLELDEQASILAKFRDTKAESVKEQNEVLMMLLRAHCTDKQIRHIHDTAENRSEFLNHYLGVGGSNVFTKAKKSLSNSFDQFLKKKRMSLADLGTESRNMSLPLSNNLNKSPSDEAWGEVEASESSNIDKNSEGSFRSRSSTLDGDKESYLTVKNWKQPSMSPERSTTDTDKGVKSSMIDIFLKVGNSPKGMSSKSDLDAGSWRQAIFKRVVTPKRQVTDGPRKKRTTSELRILWKQAIKQAILLVRMEKENERLKTQQEESAVKRIKLEYDEMKPGQREVMEVWEMIANKESQFKINKPMLLQAIKQGVPRGRRGDVWQFLAEQHCLKSAPPDPVKYPNYNMPYEQLLRQLTSHQHAILIDLGRTFPNHSYFSSPLGPGQLALFNLLKAYSLLDPEVGYCQGLSFVAGVLLLHLEEANAFSLLRHLMFRRNLRYQYLPDMTDIQIKLYQLSRAIHDQLPELYRHLDIHDVAPTLYAAPWILTIFASQFPLGFVTRVFDLVFLEGPDVVFRVALALLSYHKDEILHCESFEEIMNYFKNQLTSINKITLDKVMKYIYTNDITKQLEEYRVEYQVLQEEMSAVQPKEEEIHKLESENKILIAQNKALTSQLETALGNLQRLEKNRALQQSQLNRLEMQSRGLEVTVAVLGNFINNLVEEKVDIDIPDEIRRILSQITLSEKKRSEVKGQGNLLKLIQERNDRIQPPDKLMVKSLSTGKITVPSTLESMSRANSLDIKADIFSNELKNQLQKANFGSTERKSFFSSSHSNILEQQRSSFSYSNLTNSRINIKVQEIDTDEYGQEDVLAVENKNTSPTHSIDSGVGTPQSPRSTHIHPLSNCDVSFTFSGTKELKNLKSMKK